jgi:hypothetical protein
VDNISTVPAVLGRSLAEAMENVEIDVYARVSTSKSYPPKKFAAISFSPPPSNNAISVVDSHWFQCGTSIYVDADPNPA